MKTLSVGPAKKQKKKAVLGIIGLGTVFAGRTGLLISKSANMLFTGSGNGYNILQ